MSEAAYERWQGHTDVMPIPSLVGLTLDALVGAGRYAELLGALEYIPGLAAVRGRDGALLLHKVAGSELWKHWRHEQLTQSSIIAAVYEAHVDVIHTCDDDGMMPIHHAASQGSLKATQFLLEKSRMLSEADRDYERPEQSRDSAHFLPIHLALENRVPTDVVLELLWADADCDTSGNEKDGYGWELLHLACAFDASARVVNWLLDNGRWESALVPLSPLGHGGNCDCRRCSGRQEAPMVVTPLALREGCYHPGRLHPRVDGSLFALPIHLAARCGAKRRVIAALVAECENIPNCEYMRNGHVIDPYGYLPSDYALAQGVSRDIVEALFRLEACVRQNATFTQSQLDFDRRRMSSFCEPERQKRRREVEASSGHSGKRPCTQKSIPKHGQWPTEDGP